MTEKKYEDIYERHTRETQKILDNKFLDGKVKNLYMPEVLAGLNEIDDFDNRVKALRANSERSLNTFLYFTFRNDRSRVKKEWVDVIEYKSIVEKDEDFAMAPGALSEEAQRFYVFYRKDVPEMRLKDILGGMLEVLHPYEASLLKGMFYGEFEEYPNVTKELVDAAFPDLFMKEKEEDAKKEAEEQARREAEEEEKKRKEEDDKRIKEAAEKMAAEKEQELAKAAKPAPAAKKAPAKKTTKKPAAAKKDAVDNNTQSPEKGETKK